MGRVPPRHAAADGAGPASCSSCGTRPQPPAQLRARAGRDRRRAARLRDDVPAAVRLPDGVRVPPLRLRRRGDGGSRPHDRRDRRRPAPAAPSLARADCSPETPAGLTPEAAPRSRAASPGCPRRSSPPAGRATIVTPAHTAAARSGAARTWCGTGRRRLSMTVRVTRREGARTVITTLVAAGSRCPQYDRRAVDEREPGPVAACTLAPRRSATRRREPTDRRLHEQEYRRCHSWRLRERPTSLELRRLGSRGGPRSQGNEHHVTRESTLALARACADGRSAVRRGGCAGDERGNTQRSDIRPSHSEVVPAGAERRIAAGARSPTTRRSNAPRARPADVRARRRSTARHGAHHARARRRVRCLPAAAVHPAGDRRAHRGLGAEQRLDAPGRPGHLGLPGRRLPQRRHPQRRSPTRRSRDWSTSSTRTCTRRSRRRSACRRRATGRNAHSAADALGPFPPDYYAGDGDKIVTLVSTSATTTSTTRTTHSGSRTSPGSSRRSSTTSSTATS